MSIPPPLARTALVAGIALCLATWVVGVAIPYFDYDDATQGIFVNDLSFRHDLDASFEGRPDKQNVYRTQFAAQRLSFSLPLSWAERALSLPGSKVEGLLRAAALIFGLGGSLLAAATLLPAPSTAVERWAVVAAAAAHPSLALHVRTGASFQVFTYALFWLCALAAFRWLQSGRPAWIYLAAAGAVACVLNPYPPLLCWPLAALALAVWEGRVLRTVRSKHLYAAVAAALMIAALSTWAMAAAYDTSLAAFLARQAAFRAARSGSVGLSQLVGVNPIDKLTKLADQQLLFRFDDLGDPSREDAVWITGAPQPAVWLWALAAAVGLWIALRDRSASDRKALTITGALLLFFFTVSYPEGRFVLALLPCWGYFALRAVGFAFRSDGARQLVVGIGLLLVAADTERTIRRDYLPVARATWVEFEGTHEAAPLVANLPEGGRGTFVAMPHPRRFEPELYFRMAMPAGAEWLARPEFVEAIAQPAPRARFVALAYADEREWLAYLTARGFERRASLVGEITGRELVLLVRADRAALAVENQAELHSTDAGVAATPPPSNRRRPS